MEAQHSPSVTTGMSPELYEAVMISDVQTIRLYINQLDSQLTPTNNTLLHVLAQFTDSGELVKEILNSNHHSIQTLNSILLRVNTKGDTALHIAARNGRLKIVNALLHFLKSINSEDVESRGGADTITNQLLRMANKVGDTALHEAIKFSHGDVAMLLIKEDPEFVYPSNNMAETPLYLAAEKGNCHVVHLILDTCKSAIPSYDGPHNMTALHAAIVHDCEGCTEALLKRLPFLTKKVDASGWTVLHVAAQGNFVSRVRQLLNADPSLAYITAGPDNGMTALHVATAAGMVKVMGEILRHNPDCWEINTSDDQNLLHIAVDCERLRATNFILGKPWAGLLANEKDVNGNTPLHLYAVSSYVSVPNIVNCAADVNAYNKENFTPIDLLEKSDVFSYHEGTIKNQLRKKGGMQSARNMATEEKMKFTQWKKFSQEAKKIVSFDYKKLAETYIIVSTLIATITFAAGFTLPGGYDGNPGPHQGMVVLTRKTVFQAFIISNTIAVISSILAVFLLLLASSYATQSVVHKLRKAAAFLLRGSVIAMLIAFTTGSYCVLDYSPGLQITVCILGGISILVICFLIMRVLLSSAYPRLLVRHILSVIFRFLRKQFNRAQCG